MSFMVKPLVMFIFEKIMPVVGVLFAFFVLHKSLMSLDFSSFKISYGLLAVSFLLLLPIFYLDGIGWHLINRALGVKAPLSESVQVWLLSSLARYIPGVVWGYASRLLFLRERKASIAIISLSFGLESIFLAGGSLLLGMGLLAFPLYRDVFMYQLHFMLNFMVAILFIGGLIGWFYAKRLEVFFVSFMNTYRIQLKRLLAVFLFYLMLWVLFALAFGFFVAALNIPLLAPAHLLMFGLIFCLSFGFSFILIIFPGGLGVREVILFYLLSLCINPAMAALIAVVARVWVMVAEIVAVSACYYFSITREQSQRG